MRFILEGITKNARVMWFVMASAIIFSSCGGDGTNGTHDTDTAPSVVKPPPHDTSGVITPPPTGDSNVIMPDSEGISK